MDRSKFASSYLFFLRTRVCVCVVHAQAVQKRQTGTVVMLSPKLGACRVICISRFSHPEFRSLFFSNNDVFCVLCCCFIIIFSLSSSFPSLTCFHLIASRKSCSFGEKTRFFFLAYILSLLLVSDMRILMLFSLRVSHSL